MDLFLSNFFKYNDYKVEILLRSFKNGPHWFIKSIGMNEEEYFRNIYGEEINILDHGMHNIEIYKQIARSHLSISSLSSSILEANLYGYKSLYLNFGNDMIYYSGLPRDIVLLGKDPNLIKSEISKLINQSKEKRLNIIKGAIDKSNYNLNFLKNLISYYS